MADMLRQESTGNHVRYTQTPHIKIMNEWAVKNEMNRACTDKWSELLDPEGIHVLIMSFHHFHKGGKPCDYHYRTVWDCKMKDSDNRARITLDIPPYMYEQLIFDHQIKEKVKDGVE